MENTDYVEIKLETTLQGSAEPLHLEADFTLQRGKITALMGESGAGKTSIIRMIAGLMPPNTGKIIAYGTVWEDTVQGIRLPPQARSVGLVFQDYALFPHMTVTQNIRFAATSQTQVRQIESLLEALGLSALQRRYPRQLSGGQQQRVALARALIRQPDVLLLDEPLAALDAPLRERMQHFFRSLSQLQNVATLWVSHHAVEVAALADTVCQLSEGKIRRQGTPASILPTLGAENFELIGTVKALNPTQKSVTLLTQQGLIAIPLLKTVEPITLGKLVRYNMRTQEIQLM